MTTIPVAATVKRFERVFLIGMLVVSVGLNVALSRRVRVLDVGAAPAFVPPGTAVPALVVAGLDGRQITIAHDSSKRGAIIYVLSPACHWCARNAANIAALSAQTGGKYRMIGLALSAAGLAEYVKTADLPFEVFIASDESRRAYMLNSTPQTIVVDASSVVVQNWAGAYNAQIQPAVERYFGLRLPGLLPEPQRPAKKGE